MPLPPPASSARVAILLLLASGAALRLPFINSRPLWFDELLIASQLLREGLLRRITDPQAPAPPGFHLLVWGGVRLLGTSEWAWRLWPYLFGVGSLALIALLLSRLAGAWTAALGTLLLATRTWPLAYSSELKPYTADGFFALLILLSAVRLFAVPGRRENLLAGACIVLAPWFSYAGLFAVAGVIAVGLAGATRPREAGGGDETGERNGRRREGRVLTGTRKGRSELHRWAALAAASAVSTLVLYLLVVSRQRAPFLIRWWETRGGYPPSGSTPLLLGWLWRNIAGLFGGMLIPGWPWIAPLNALLVVLGCAALWRGGQGRVAAAIGVALTLPLPASFLRFYPFAASGETLQSRVMLFVVPLLVVLLAAGIGMTVDLLGRTRLGSVAGTAGLALFLWPGLAQIPVAIGYPILRVVEPNREMLDIVRRRAGPEDLLFVNYQGGGAFALYGGDLPCRATVGRKPRAFVTSVDELLPQIEPLLRSDRRVWLFCSSPNLAAEKDNFRNAASRFRKLELVAGEGNTLLFLTEPRSRSASAPGSREEPDPGLPAG